MEGHMNVEIHTPSTLLLLVSLALAVLALVCFFLTPATSIGFGLAMLAYCVMGIGTIVKT
jgi:hypothetical protein